MLTKIIEERYLQSNLINILDSIRDDEKLILIKRNGTVESALINIDSLEDLLASQKPSYLASIKEAKAGETFSPKEVFGEIW